MSTPIKVMTFNMRISTPVDGDNWFRNRKPKIAEVIRRENPDIIGFQEVNEEMQDFLTEAFPEYIILGHGRKENYSWEGTPIAYRKSRFLLHTFRERWLSLEEDLPGSRLHGMGQSDCPRVFLCAELIDRTCYKPFSFYNVHLDHLYETAAQTVETALLYKDIGASPFPYVLTGDFNAMPDSTVVKTILATNGRLGTVNATENIGGTFHGFGRYEPAVDQIDYVFTNMKTDSAASYLVPDDNTCGYYYSDHYAVCAYVSID